ncbi:MAG TPA: hypothetical protein VLC93_15680, partial [Myxococcota bacterium]|nr:hypothetical protein [Myxococcota bacterium]
MEPATGRAARIAAVAIIVFSVALALVAVFDHASVDRFPAPTKTFLMLAAMAYTGTGAVVWRLARAAEPPTLLTRYRHALLALLAAYAVSFLPLGVAV